MWRKKLGSPDSTVPSNKKLYEGTPRERGKGREHEGGGTFPLLLAFQLSIILKKMPRVFCRRQNFEWLPREGKLSLMCALSPHTYIPYKLKINPKSLYHVHKIWMFDQSSAKYSISARPLKKISTKFVYWGTCTKGAVMAH